MSRKRKVTVFLASPGDLKPERQAFREQVEDLNERLGRRDKIGFVPQLWEDAPASTGRRVQGVLDQRVEECDVFILALHRRWGQAAPDSDSSSYTEEEFRCALDRFVRTGKPEIFVFFKELDPDSRTDPDPQLRKVLAFRDELNRTRTVLYRTFADVAGFRQLVDLHLRSYGEGAPRPAVIAERLPLPMELVEVVKAHEKADRGRGAAADVGAAELLDLARSASGAFEAGRTEEARQAFAEVVAGTTNGEALFLAFDFYRRAGDWRSAQNIVEVVLACSGPDAENVDTAAALAHLGAFYWGRGDLGQAKRLWEKSLLINQKLGCTKGVADQYTRMGMVLAESDWVAAQQMFENAIELNEQIDRPRGVSFASYQLARARMMRDEPEELARAEKELRRALRIDRQRDSAGALARDHEALAEIHDARDETAKALKAYRAAAKLFREANNEEGELSCNRAIDALE